MIFEIEPSACAVMESILGKVAVACSEHLLLLSKPVINRCNLGSICRPRVYRTSDQRTKTKIILLRSSISSLLNNLFFML